VKHAFCPELETRLLRYVAIETASDAASATVPSTAAQFDLLRVLEDELRTLGAHAVHLAANGFLYATLPATVTANVPRLALLAHVDTAAGVGGGPVKPRVHRAYTGAPILFPADELLLLMPESCPALGEKLGHDLVTASGDSLLGADDKAGVAILMTLAHHLLAHPELPHGELRLCFTPDEEIGTGIQQVDLARLAADVAYTLDGGAVGEISYENFCADKATITITSRKGRASALDLAAQIKGALPHAAHPPEMTEERAGFLLLTGQEGTATACTLHFIARDFEEEKLAEYGRQLAVVCAGVQASAPHAHITCTITPQARNMRDRLLQETRPVRYAHAAMEALGITPHSPPIRGGFDGSHLTALGVPTPNLFTGMQNIHSPLEWISLQDMALAVAVLVELVQRWVRVA
jgi:tripeptide aminopeptidase